jgi:hypothetical protein
MSTLCTLADVVAESKITGELSADDKAYLYTLIEQASGRLETVELKTLLEPRVATYYHDALRTPVSPNGTTLTLRFPLVELTSVVLGDGTDATTSVQLRPRGTSPALMLAMTTSLYHFYQLGGNTLPYEAIAVSGQWCYHPDWANAWAAVDTLDASINSTATTLTPDNNNTLSAGMLIRIGTEYLRVTEAHDHTATVIRGVNGTTAANHTAGTVISAFQPAAVIRRVATRWVSYLWSRRAAFEQTSFDGVAQVTYPTDLPAELKSVLVNLRPSGIVGGI